jgi:hypothetical protein
MTGRWMLIPLACSSLWLAGGTLPAAGPGQEIAVLLKEIGQAINVSAWDQLGELDLIGQSNYFGVDGAVRFHVDRQGRFLLVITSPLGESRGWDGQSAWLGDRQGGWRRLHFRDEELALLLYPFIAGTWLRHQDAYEFTLLPTLPENPGLRLSIRRRGGSQQVMLRLDPQTKRPAELRSRSRDAEVQTTFNDYREVNGLQVPMTIRQQSRGTGNVLRFTDAIPRRQPLADRYVFSPQRPTQVWFEAGVPATIEVKRSRTGHLLVQPRLNGRDAGNFLFDSSAGAHAIHRRLAQDLQLPTMGKLLAAGVGDSVPTQFRKATQLELGPLRLPEQLFVELDLTALSVALGEPIGGVLGYPLFQAAVVDLDLGGPNVALHAPGHFTLSSGQWQELRFDGNVACLQARWAGVEKGGWFRLDPGAAVQVLFYSAEASGLTSSDPAAKAGASDKPTGRAQMRSAPLKWFELAGKRFENLQVTFPAAEGGASAGDPVVGTIGHGLLRSFRIVFDCGLGRVALIAK